MAPPSGDSAAVGRMSCGRREYAWARLAPAAKSSASQLFQPLMASALASEVALSAMSSSTSRRACALAAWEATSSAAVPDHALAGLPLVVRARVVMGAEEVTGGGPLDAFGKIQHSGP